MGRDLRLLIGFAVTAFLAACGGSSGGDAPPPPSATPPPSVSLSVERSPIAPGQTAVLNWTSSNTISCTASGGWSGAKTTSGSERTDALLDATEFELTCSGDGVQASDSVIVTIDEAANQEPVPERFGTSADEVAPGELVTFDWTVSDPDGDSLRCVFTPTGVSPEVVFEDCNGANTFEFTYDLPGSYTPLLKISDGFSTVIKRRILKVTSPFVIADVKPRRNTFVETELNISAFVVSPLEVAEVRASVGDETIDLVFEPGIFGSFVGTISLEGLPRGPHILDVVAEDIAGEQTRFVQPFVYDLMPELTVTAPLNYSVATPGLRVAASCIDDDPAGCELEVTIGDEILLSGRNAIDAEVDLSAFDGSIVGFTVLARDSTGREATHSVRQIHVESSPVLSRVFDVPGRILDVQGSRLLYWSASPRRLEIADMADMTTEIVPNPVDGTVIVRERSYGYSSLTPYGAVFIASGLPGSRRGLYDWNRGVLENLGEAWAATLPAVQVVGNVVVWNPTSSSTSIRDIESRTVYPINDTAGIADVADNGTVAYSTGDGQIVLFSGGMADIITDDPGFRNAYPVTDGTRTIYLKYEAMPSGPTRRDAIVLYDGVEEIEILSRDVPSDSVIRPPGYQLVPGWIAYQADGNIGQSHVWLVDPAGERRQLTLFGDSSEIELLNTNGEVIFIRGERRYLASPDGTMTEISSTLGKLYAVDGEWYVIIGRSLFQILP